MKSTSLPVTCLALATALFLAIAPAVSAPAAPMRAGSHPLPPIAASTSTGVAVSDEQVVPKGVVHEGDLVSVMGKVRIDGEVTGQVVVVLGEVEISGEVQGQVVAVMSRAHFADSARVHGDLIAVGWTALRDPQSQVTGEIVNVGFMNLLPFMGNHGGIAGLLRFIFILHLIALAFLFVILLIITALVPRRLSVMAAAFPVKWVWSFLTGALAYIGMVVGVIFLAATIIGIPLAMLVMFVFAVTKWVGLAAICYLLGQTVGRNLFGRELPHLACVLGGFVIYALISMVPLLGAACSMVMKVLAVGLSLTTKFGTEPTAVPMGATPAPAGPQWAGPSPSGPSAPPVVS